jgi:hypothetical protein
MQVALPGAVHARAAAAGAPAGQGLGHGNRGLGSRGLGSRVRVNDFINGFGI